MMTNAALAAKKWTPNWAVHPGSVLEEHLQTRGLSQAELARLADLTPKLVSTIIKGTNPVTAETALRLERVLGLKAYVWTGLQSKWDLFQARTRAERPQAKTWLSLLPIKELKKRKYLPESTDDQELVDRLLHLFSIGTPEAYAAKIQALAVHHRRSLAYESSEHHIFTWLMLGESKAREMNMPAFSSQKFEEALRKIRTFTTESPETFETKMRALCKQAGVALILEPPISKTCLFGSARWFDRDHAIIQMSLRMKTNDHFWWTFFHEAAHIILHRGQNFLDDKNGVGGGVEEQADRWAENILVGKARFERFKSSRPRSKNEIVKFADEIEVHPGIVVGMLQHSGIIPYSAFNGLKDHFEWIEEP
ncbi:MAG: hypothetical protein OJF62_002781 [Pseudolabrys sp.]|jgi:HTH-type transcriptional regulator/antitoxin HigA|nr:hypothetical protein [Pseudolabrys sp.]